MTALFALAWKSLFIAAGALVVLRAMRHRSAADRSLVAHLGLFAVLALPAVALALPPLEVAAPMAMTAPIDAVTQQATALAEPVTTPPARAPEVAESSASFPATGNPGLPSVGDVAIWIYAAPAILLVLFTLIALGRLALLKAGASVLVDGHWLTALARAQRRMGFKNGTALLTSDQLSSPISWGIVRPVILLNREAAAAHREAEAIIAHELAHVAHFDWAKLLLSRITVALFWFNPLVWLLAREAHQLREESADDSVLASDVDETEYAQLLVGIARHECRGLLLGAHGVAPGRNSLHRRVRRVLDTALSRASGGWRWTSAVAFFAAGMAVPVAALNLVAGPVETETAAAKTVAAAAPGRIVAASTPAMAGSAPVNAGSILTATIAPVPAPNRLDVDDRSVDHADHDDDIDLDLAVDVDPNADADEEGVNPVFFGQIGEAISAVSVKHDGAVVVRHGPHSQVRVLRGDQRNVSVEYEGGSLSARCLRDCRGQLIEVTTPKLEALAVKSGGTITIQRGFPIQDTLALAVKSGGTIDARLLRARTVAAATSGGGTILTSAEGTLAASTNGGGTIRHWGKGNVASSVRGGGRIEPGGT